jgi:hypothetical protein
MAQIVQIVRASFGPDAHMAMTVMREIERGTDRHLAVYSMGTVPEDSLGWMFRTAAQHLPDSAMRELAIEDEPEIAQ